LSGRFVFDTGPLSAFARVGRLDVLAARYWGRALWAVEVREEIRRGAVRFPWLDEILSAGWLADAVRMTDPADLLEIERLRRALGGRGEQPPRHLGEAATLVLARREAATAVLDDRDARRLADALGIPFTGTLGILRASVGDGVLSRDEAWAIIQAMTAAGDRLPPIAGPDWFG
jgi:predicted nucleic acid-binding protein